jgi:hypothetical protein
MARAAVASLVAGLLALPASGCGLGPGTAPAGTRLTLTEDFGARAQAELPTPRTGAGDTVMRLLQRNAKVTTRYGGGFVQSIAGVAGGRRAGRPYDWFFYVNGVESEKGAASVKVREGDRVWWDRHDWGLTMRVPAVVGSFPEPLRHGRDGKRLPVRVECIDPQGEACRTVRDRLTAAGVVAAGGGLQTSQTAHTLRVLVGPYATLRADDAAGRLERGPRASGVYARPARDGRSVSMLDATGRVTRTLGAGTGLIGATRVRDGQPVWLITGTDDRGVLDAARALEESALKDRFALAVSDGRGVALPEVAARR